MFEGTTILLLWSLFCYAINMAIKTMHNKNKPVLKKKYGGSHNGSNQCSSKAIYMTVKG